MYEQCELPPSVRYAFSIKYNRSGKLFNFWDRLSNSVRSPDPTSSRALLPTSLASPKFDGKDRLSGIEKTPFQGLLFKDLSISTNEKPSRTDEALKWWDADKKASPTPSNTDYPPPPSYSQTMGAEKQSSNHSITGNKPDISDTFSINSSAQLISQDAKKKWFKRLKNSIKKKDKDKNLRQAVPE